jgi:hypothetical protein
MFEAADKNTRIHLSVNHSSAPPNPLAKLGTVSPVSFINDLSTWMGDVCVTLQVAKLTAQDSNPIVVGVY